jgi:uncharacterized protein (DUF1697 family)
MILSVALLRGINVGGNKKVPMADLKKAMAKAGYANVKTLLASGNIVFEAKEKGDVLRKNLETLLKKTFGFEVPVIVRTMDDVKMLLKKDPFKKIVVTENVRLYVTFLGEGSKAKRTITIPYQAPTGDFEILSANGSEVLSVLRLKPGTTTPKVMDVLEKEFGKNVTTRNWNTVEKIGSLE